MSSIVHYGDNTQVLATLAEMGKRVQACVTSPPYYSLRDYNVPATDWPAVEYFPMPGLPAFAVPAMSCPLGMEPTPEAYISHIVHTFRLVRELLADDGTCWINLGDSYAASGKQSPQKNLKTLADRMAPRKNPRQVNCDSDGLIARPDKKLPPGLKAKDLLGIPWRAAFALQADGWFLRQDCIWNKPNPMPESVTDRCTKSHEYMFLLAKSPRYYFDHIAIREPGVIPAGTKGAKGSAERFAMEGVNSRPPEYKVYDGMRNKRSVWRITTKPFKGAHFATFPPELVEPPILAGTSAAGHCPACGIRWIRDTTRQAITPDATVSDTRKPLHTDTYSRHKVKIPGGQSLVSTVTETIGWKASCSCGVDPVPDIVLDPFGGSGTTAAVASRLNRDYCIIELNPAYSEFIDERIARKK